MEMLKQASSDFEDWVREHIESKLEEWPEDVEVYGYELANELCEEESWNGYAIEGTWEARHFIQEHEEESGEMMDWVLDRMVDSGINPFREPCRFTWWLLLWGVDRILAGCPWCIRHEKEKGRLDARAKTEITGYIENNHIWF